MKVRGISQSAAFLKFSIRNALGYTAVMPNFTRTTKDGEVSLYYEIHGQGVQAPTILLIAPGGMRSAVSFWEHTPWNPITSLQAKYRVIAMDQRNAGQSVGPVAADHGWHTYAEDQVALLDHLEVGDCHVGGMCIGGPYCFGLIQALGDRVLSAVLWQTIGLDDNRTAFFDMFDSWAVDLQSDTHRQVPEQAWTEFRARMFGGEFLFNVDEDYVAKCTTPLLVLCGNDLYHPMSSSKAVARLAPQAQMIEQWKEGEALQQAESAVASFLDSHSR